MKLELGDLDQEKLLLITKILKSNGEIATMETLEANFNRGTGKDLNINFKIVINFPVQKYITKTKKEVFDSIINIAEPI